MFSFSSNFAFLRFSLLFFVVLIYGYWGVDLNSEEVYIAFTFFAFIAAAFVFFRLSVITMCLNIINRRALRLIQGTYRHFLLSNHVVSELSLLPVRSRLMRTVVRGLRARFVTFVALRGSALRLRQILQLNRFTTVLVLTEPILRARAMSAARERSFLGFSASVNPLFFIKI